MTHDLRRGLQSFAASRLASGRCGEVCSQAPRACGRKMAVELPAAKQGLSARFAGMRDKLLQVSGIVDVERDAGLLQHNARSARGLSCGEVWFEAVVPETQGE